VGGKWSLSSSFRLSGLAQRKGTGKNGYGVSFRLWLLIALLRNLERGWRGGGGKDFSGV